MVSHQFAVSKIQIILLGATTPPTAPSLLTTGPSSCPPGVPIVRCANAPTACEEEICPNFRNARCVFDNCGGCNTKFFVGQREVTDRCGRGEYTLTFHHFL